MFVALIAVVLLSLAAVALMRSVHTSTLVIGNLAFRQAAMSMSTAAVETAVYDMFAPTKQIADLTTTIRPGTTTRRCSLARTPSAFRPYCNRWPPSTPCTPGA